MSNLNIEKSDLISSSSLRAIGVRTLSAMSSYALDYSDETVFDDIEGSSSIFSSVFLAIARESHVSELSARTLVLWVDHGTGPVSAEDARILRDMSVDVPQYDLFAASVYDQLPVESQAYLDHFGLWAAALFTTAQGDPLRDDSVPPSTDASHRTLEEFEPFEWFWDKASQFHPGGGIGGEVWEDWPTR